MNFKPIPFLKNNNINLTIQKGSRWDGCLTYEETSYKNASTNYSNDSGDKSILDVEGNVCGIISIPSIAITFDNDNIHALQNLPKRYIYGY